MLKRFSVLILVAIAFGLAYSTIVTAQNAKRICTDLSCLVNSGSHLDIEVSTAPGNPEVRMTTLGDLRAGRCLGAGGIDPPTGGSCICREPATDRLYADKDCDSAAKEVGEEYLDNAPGGGGALTDGDKIDITVSDSGATWQINPGVVGSNEVTNGGVVLGTDTTGNYAAGSAPNGAATSGATATGFFQAGIVDDVRVSGAFESDEVQAGGSTFSVSNSTVPTDWIVGVQSALASFLDHAMLYKLVLSPTDAGGNVTRLVTTTYASSAALTAGVTCNAANLGRVEYITSGSCSGPPDYTGICQCEVTDPGDDAGGGATPTFGWREMYPTPGVWLTRMSGGSSGGYVAMNPSLTAHLPGYRMEFYEDTAGACQQAEYLDGAGPPWPQWGRVGIAEEMLISLGYVVDADAVRALWGWVRTPTGVVIDPAAGGGATASAQNFTDGWFYIWWGGTNQLYAGSRRNSSSNIFSMGSTFDMSNATTRGYWKSAHMKGMIATSTLAEVISPAAVTPTWSARFQAKLGYPFMMGAHGSADPPDSNWVSVSTTSTVPNVASSTAHGFRPIVAICRRSGAGEEAGAWFHKAALGAAVYDYD